MYIRYSRIANKSRSEWLWEEELHKEQPHILCPLLFPYYSYKPCPLSDSQSWTFTEFLDIHHYQGYVFKS